MNGHYALFNKLFADVLCVGVGGEYFALQDSFMQNGTDYVISIDGDF